MTRVDRSDAETLALVESRRGLEAPEVGLRWDEISAEEEAQLRTQGVQVITLRWPDSRAEVLRDLDCEDGGAELDGGTYR